jgi:cytochrome c551/c552
LYLEKLNTNMKKVFVVLSLLAGIAACSGGGEKKAETSAAAEPAAPAATTESASSDKGIGKFTQVEVGATLDAAMAEKGQTVYDVKCLSCHKLTDEKLVGPGWKGVTSRRTPEWIMNFSTNVDEMLAKDPEAQAMLEVCLVKMPNQNLSDDEARNVLEFMRKNDGVK